ncbi:MAG: undecaprenyl-phosphate galactose phosphotransferase WbaP [Sulfuricella sp.]|nr:undecaprenyl-phosphate galactose phosphotransferase WbaP [Sulfuricella sp.]
MKIRIDNALLAKAALILGDMLAFLAAFILGRSANWAYDHSFQDAFFGWPDERGQVRLVLFSLVILVSIVWFWSVGHYSRRKPFWDEFHETLKILVIAAGIDATMVYFGKWQFSRLWLLSTWMLAFILVPLVRVAIKRALLRLGFWLRPTVIIGAGENAREASVALQSEPLMGLDVIAYLVPDGSPVSESLEQSPIPLLPLSSGPMTQLLEMDFPHVVIALDAEDLLTQQSLINLLNIRYIDLNVIPSLRGLPLLGMEITHVFSHEVLILRVRNNLGRRVARFAKRLFDLVVSFLLLLVLWPCFAYLALRIRTDGSPAIFAHERIGRQGEPFRCYKFRSMIADADRVLAELLAKDADAREEWARDFKLRNDPRITPIGAFLRKTSLDELPQLWNVFKGEMSLVGPRPIVTEEMARYGEQLGYYLEARPGMTGLWQISGRNDVDYSARVNLDSWYVRNWSLWYDIVIMLKTVSVVWRRHGAY